MKSENEIRCPYCDKPYETNDLWIHEGEILECQSCGKVFRVVDIEAVTYVTTRKLN